MYPVLVIWHILHDFTSIHILANMLCMKLFFLIVRNVLHVPWCDMNKELMYECIGAEWVIPV